MIAAGATHVKDLIYVVLVQTKQTEENHKLWIVTNRNLLNLW